MYMDYLIYFSMCCGLSCWIKWQKCILDALRASGQESNNSRGADQHASDVFPEADPPQEDKHTIIEVDSPKKMEHPNTPDIFKQWVWVDDFGDISTKRVDAMYKYQ